MSTRPRERELWRDWDWRPPSWGEPHKQPAPWAPGLLHREGSARGQKVIPEKALPPSPPPLSGNEPCLLALKPFRGCRWPRDNSQGFSTLLDQRGLASATCALSTLSPPLLSSPPPYRAPPAIAQALALSAPSPHPCFFASSTPGHSRLPESLLWTHDTGAITCPGLKCRLHGGRAAWHIRRLNAAPCNRGRRVLHSFSPSLYSHP